MYNIHISSESEELWRYNIVASCAGFDAEGAEIYVVGDMAVVTDDFSDDGDYVQEKPDWYEPSRSTIDFECGEAEHIRVVIDVVPHTLPNGTIVNDFPPFPMEVWVTRLGELIYHEHLPIDQWCGESISLEL